MEEKTDTNSTRMLEPPDGTSAAWYILTILGIYGVIFLFRLASNILRRSDKSLEDIHYSNWTSKLQNKESQSKAAKSSTVTVRDTAILEPNQTCPGPMCRDSGSPTGTQEPLEG